MVATLDRAKDRRRQAPTAPRRRARSRPGPRRCKPKRRSIRKLYETLPAEEEAYWHPHNYELLSGPLQMPGLPDAAADAALRRKLNSYGKTWHFWKTGVHEQAADEMPLGPPHLAWSFNYDGEPKAGLVEARDQRMGLNTAEERRDRQEWVSAARPQGGVSAIVDGFPNATPIPAYKTPATRRPGPCLCSR